MSGAANSDEIRAEAMCQQIHFIAEQQKAGTFTPDVPTLEGLLAGVVAWGQCALSPSQVQVALGEAYDRLTERVAQTGARPHLKIIAGSRKG